LAHGAHDDAPPLAADGSPLKEGDTVLVVAKLLGAAPKLDPLDPLVQTGVAAIELEAYPMGYHKDCVKLSSIMTVVKRAPS
jgi:hypothetical protein